MTDTGSSLPLVTLLAAVRVHGVNAYEYLVESGWPPKVVYAKFEKAARRGYTDYGVTVRRPWLTPKGVALLAEGPSE